jgi:hypothetical protein
MNKITKISPPSHKSTVGKGTPPPTEKPTNNLAKKMDDDMVALNFRVTAEFRKRIRQYALDNDMTAVQVMLNAIEGYIKK